MQIIRTTRPSESLVQYPLIELERASFRDPQKHAKLQMNIPRDGEAHPIPGTEHKIGHNMFRAQLNLIVKFHTIFRTMGLPK